jgi:hypothetical protein
MYNLQRGNQIVDYDETTGEAKYKEEFIHISGFASALYSIDFCLDESIAPNHITLVFDEDPTFDGEELACPERMRYVRAA